MVGIAEIAGANFGKWPWTAGIAEIAGANFGK
jgi:hypothetical protein